MKTNSRFICAALSIIMSISASASGTWTLQGNAYKVDTLSHIYLGPGTTQTSLELSGGSKLRVFYTTTDLTNPNVEVKSIKHGDKWAATTTVSSAAQSHTNATTTYFAGVNADFFANLAPCGINIVDGETVCNSQSTGWSLFGITDKKEPKLGGGSMTMSVISNGVSTGITGLNITRYTDYLVLYSRWKSTTSETNPYGTEVTLIPESTPMTPGATVTMRVGCAPVSGVGSMTIPEGGYVLSGHGTMATFVAGLKQGDAVQVKCSLTIDGVDGGRIMQAAGGKPMIVSGGKVLDTQGELDHLVALNPRTAVGYSADKKKLVMLVVDGRSTISVGVVSKVLADIMINVGCSEAMNFDGGGSSTLYTKDFGVLNVPSDGTERAVTNGLYLTTRTTSDKTIASIRFVDFAKQLPRYGTYTPKFYGYNQYGQLVDKDVQGVQLSCDSNLGTVSSDKKSVTAEGTGYQLLTATYNGMTASMPIEIVEGEVKCRLSQVIEDGYKGYPVEVVSQSGTDMIPMDRSKLEWRSEDAAIATVDAMGVVKGVKDGTVNIHGTMGSITTTLPVTVQKPTAHEQALDPLNEIDKWTVTMSGGTDKQVTAHEGGMKLVFTGVTARSCYVKLARDIELWSLPDSLKIIINPGDVAVTTIKVAYRVNGSSVNVYTLPVSLKQNEDNDVRIAMKDMFDAADRANYPVQISYVNLSINQPSTGVEHTMKFPTIATVYDVIDPSSGVGGVSADSQLVIYPNPVDHGADVMVNVGTAASSEVSVHTLGGQLVAEYRLTPTNGTVSLNTAKWVKGWLVLSVKASDGRTTTAKIYVK